MRVRARPQAGGRGSGGSVLAADGPPTWSGQRLIAAAADMDTVIVIILVGSRDGLSVALPHDRNSGSAGG